jgi:hypothetical protein
VSNAYGQFWCGIHIPHIVMLDHAEGGCVRVLTTSGHEHIVVGTVQSVSAEIRNMTGGIHLPFAWDVMGVTVTVDEHKGQFSFKWNGNWYRRDSLADARASIVDLMEGRPE